jgi:hypothetical protein
VCYNAERNLKQEIRKEVMKKISTIVAGLAVVLGLGFAVGGNVSAFVVNTKNVTKAECTRMAEADGISSPTWTQNTGETGVNPTGTCNYDNGKSSPIQSGSESARGDGMSQDLMGTVKAIINTVLVVVGLISVAFLIYGGVQYTTSAGQAEKVKNAKNTIMYSIIGLIVAILAFAVVNFVVGNIGG